MEDKDELTITINLKRNTNGTVTSSQKIEGAGFHYFEIVGLLEASKFDLIREMKNSANKMQKDKKVRLKFSAPTK